LRYHQGQWTWVQSRCFGKWQEEWTDEYAFSNRGDEWNVPAGIGAREGDLYFNFLLSCISTSALTCSVMPTTVAIVEDSAAVSASLERVLAESGECKCLCCCPNAEEALRLIPRKKP